VLIFSFGQQLDTDNGPCHVSEIPLQTGKNPLCKGEKRRCLFLAGEERRLPFEGKFPHDTGQLLVLKAKETKKCRHRDDNDFDLV
jgi:hypothetical protein